MIVSHRFVSALDTAIEGVLSEWQGRWPQMGVLALVPEAEKGSVPILQRLSQACAIPLVGAVFPALVTSDGFSVDGIWLVCFDRMPMHCLVPDLAEGDVQTIAKAVREALSTEKKGDETVAFMVFDGMLPNVSSLLHGLYEELGAAIHYAGVCAGSESFQPMPCLFDGKTLIGGGVLVIMLGREIDRVALRHDYPVSQTLMKATSAEGNRIDHIDGCPAFTVYQEVIRHEFGIDLTHDNFYDYAVHFPFGLITAVDVLVRIPVAFDADGSLWCVGEVPPNALLRLLKAPPAENSACIARLAAALAGNKEVVRRLPLLAFYCAGRRMHLGAGAVSEIAQLAAATGASPLIGALSLGEIDQFSDLHVPRFHNAALVCLRVATEGAGTA